MKSDIANLRHHIELQQSIDVMDAIGGVARDWQTIALVWAEITTRGVNQAREVAREEAVLSYRFRIRWRPDVTVSNRFKLATRIFEIHAIGDLDDNKDFMVCHCQEVMP